MLRDYCTVAYRTDSIAYERIRHIEFILDKVNLFVAADISQKIQLIERFSLEHPHRFPK